MGDDRIIADRAAPVSVSQPELLAKGYSAYERYRVTLPGGTKQTRDVLRGGKVVAVLPVDFPRDEIVLVRQFRLPAHLANGRGDLVEIVAGRVDPGEALEMAAARECEEEIGIRPSALAQLFTYLTTPGLIEEEITVFLGEIDAERVPPRTTSGGEEIETMRVPIEDALAAVAAGRLRNGPLLIALQWLALNRSRAVKLLAKP